MVVERDQTVAVKALCGALRCRTGKSPVASAFLVLQLSRLAIPCLSAAHRSLSRHDRALPFPVCARFDRSSCYDRARFRRFNRTVESELRHRSARLLVSADLQLLLVL